MAHIVGLSLVSFMILITGYDAADKFHVLYTPDSLKFLASKKPAESFLKEIICACLGLSVDENKMWKGLHVADPFNTPEAVVIICLEGVSHIGNTTSNQTFILTADKNEPDVFEAVKGRIKQRYTSGGNKLLNVRLSDPKELTTENFISVLGNVKVLNVSEQTLTHLNITVKEDLQFLNELEILKAITAKVLTSGTARDNIVDFFNFRFGCLRPLINRHGTNSSQAKEAKALLDNALQEISKAFVHAYDGSVLVSTIVTEIDQYRRLVRSPLMAKKVAPRISPRKAEQKKIPRDNDVAGDRDSADEAPPTEEPAAPAEEPAAPSEELPAVSDEPPPATEEAAAASEEPGAEGGGEGGGETGGETGGGEGGGDIADVAPGEDKYIQTENEDFALVFNIIFWFGLSYMFALLAIVYVTMAMDPGRDTVIYRMTTPRIKKDV